MSDQQASHDGNGSEPSSQQEQQPSAADGTATADDNDTNATDEEGEEEEEDAQHKQFVAMLRQMISALMAHGELDKVVGLMRQVFGYYNEREYVTPAVDLERFSRDFVAADGDVEYCWSLTFDVTWFARLCYDGFLSICSYPQKCVYLLMPWIAPIRSVMDFGRMHVSKQLRKRARKYHMTVNTDFDGVVNGCVAQHGEDWLREPMQELLRQGWREAPQLHATYDATDGGGNTAQWRRRLRGCGFRVATFELWDTSTGALVAGDLG